MHLDDNQRIKITFKQLLTLVGESYVSEGGNRSNVTAAEQRKMVVDALNNHVLAPYAKPGCTKLLKTKEEFDGYKYAVIDVEGQNKPYDIIVQYLHGDSIERAYLQVKTSQGSSMLQKTLDFQITQDTNGNYQIGLNQANNRHLKTPEERQFWSAIETVLSDTTKLEIERNIEKILIAYDEKYADIQRRYKDRFQTWLDDKPKIQFGNRQFVKDILDEIISKTSKAVSSPFSIDIEHYIQWLNNVDYIQIGNYLFLVSDKNPLHLKGPNGADIPSLNSSYASTTVNFTIGKGNSIRPLYIHGYGIKERPNHKMVSLTIPQLYPTAS